MHLFKLPATLSVSIHIGLGTLVKAQKDQKLSAILKCKHVTSMWSYRLPEMWPAGGLL